MRPVPRPGSSAWAPARWPGDAALAGKIARKAMILRGASPAPPGLAAAAAASLRILQTSPEMRSNLGHNVRHMRGGLRRLGFDIADTPVPIVSVTGKVDLERLRDRLAERDIIVKLQAPGGYSDAPDVATLRLAVFSEHSPAQIDRLLGAMAELL